MNFLTLLFYCGLEKRGGLGYFQVSKLKEALDLLFENRCWLLIGYVTMLCTSDLLVNIREMQTSCQKKNIWICLNFIGVPGTHKKSKATPFWNNLWSKMEVCTLIISQIWENLVSQSKLKIPRYRSADQMTA